MASASSSSSLTRYRPVVLIICGAAAACGIYQIYKAAQPPPGPGLRRRPAVHRPRRRRGSRSASPSPATQEVPIPATSSEIVQEDAETVAETDISTQQHADRPSVHSELTELLYHIGENRAREAGYIHRGVTCDSCGTHPICGIRWHCMQCEDFDLCSECEALGEHNRTHVFGKIKIPAPALVGSVKLSQPVIYTGHPGTLPRSLPIDLRRKLHDTTTFEVEIIDALYDQFSCLTTVHAWTQDPCGLGSGIDRVGFGKGFFASYLKTPKHNLVYDRYFAFFDRKKDGIIDFEEYITTVAIHTGEKGKNAKLKAIFDGYDIDDDGFVSRKDFLRMLRSYFILQRQIVEDRLEHEEGLSLAAMERHLASAQPLGAVFKTMYDHRGEPGRVPDEKISGEDGALAMQTPAIAEDLLDEDKDRWDTIGSMRRTPPQTMKERWRRRRFYTDEEEGVAPPPEWDEEDPDGKIHDEPVVNGKSSSAMRQTPEVSCPTSPRSQSSSKDRPEDGDGTKRRLASSSRSGAERWGGYDIPPEEQDLGTDILYQVTQQGLNELLDGLFYDMETRAEQVRETVAERAKWATRIKDFQKRQQKTNAEKSDPLLATAEAVSRQGGVDRLVHQQLPIAPSPPIRAIVQTTNGTPAVGGTEDAVVEVGQSLLLLRTANVHEQMDAVERQVQDASLDQLLSDSGYSVGISRMPTYTEPDEQGELVGSGILPHLRPSTPDLERLSSRARNALHRIPSPPSPLILPQIDDRHPILRMPLEQRLREEPNEGRLQFYAYLDHCEAEIELRGGEARLTWTEFRSAVANDLVPNGKFEFLGDWIGVGQI